MKVVYCLAICILSIFSFEHSCHAAFSLQGMTPQATVVISDDSTSPEQSSAPTSLLTKKKHKHYNNHEEQPEKYDLSIISCALSPGSLVLLGTK